MEMDSNADSCFEHVNVETSTVSFAGLFVEYIYIYILLFVLSKSIEKYYYYNYTKPKMLSRS